MSDEPDDLAADVPRSAPREKLATGLSLGVATELLDQLMRQGAELQTVEVGEDGRASVRWVELGHEQPAT